MSRPRRRWTKLGTITALVLAGVIRAGAAEAEEATRPTDAARRNDPGAPLALAYTVSGGVSLGAYEAGFLYLAGEATKRSGRVSVPLYTGASAGSANALFAALASCSPANDRPSEDLGYRAWIPVGHRELFLEADVTPVSVFSRRSLAEAMELVRAKWMAGLPETCDVVVGISVTRVEARRVEVGPGLAVPVQSERLVIRLRGRGVGRPIVVSNYVDPARSSSQPILPFARDPDAPGAAEHDFELVRDLVFASAAFPVAFSPEPLHLCLTTPGTKTSTTLPTCDEPPIAALFLDGGVFDNTPLRLAHTLAERGLVADAREVRWRSLPTGGEGARPEVLHVYLDPETMAYPHLPPRAKPSSEELVSLLTTFGRELIATARARELGELVESSEPLAGHVRLTEVSYPLVSAELGAFLGFFDREFRRFDFMLGMFDAYADMFVRARAPAGLSLETFLGPAGARPPEEWRPFTCLVSWYLPGEEGRRAACDGPELERFRILLQVSLDRLYDHCRRLDRDHLAGLAHHHCVLASEGAPRPVIAGVAVEEGFDPRRAEEEGELDYTLRLLAAYRFAFADLGLGPDQAGYGRVKIRRKLLGMLNALAEAQPDGGARAALLTLGRNVVNTIAYEPPKNWGYVEIGTHLEAGLSLLPFEWNQSWMRLGLALDVKGLSTLLVPSDADVRLGVFAGPELELLALTSPLVHPMIGVRGGLQLGTRDAFGTGECTEASTKDDKRACTQLVLQSYAAVAVLERLRFQLTGVWYPIARDFDHKVFDLELAIGVHLF